MTKENTLPNVFVFASFVLEFLQIIMFSFRPEYYWGGLSSVDTNAVNIAIVGYKTFVIIFWIVFALLVLATVNGLYVGYTFHQGELASIHLLRTLRWICSLLVSVLFIPIMSVFLAGVACDYGVAPAKLMLFPNQACWASQHIGVALVSIVMILFFSVFSLFTGLTYYEFDPSIINASGRLQNRFEFGALIIKMLLVFVNYFLSNHALVFAIVQFCSAIALFVCWLVMLPAYDRKINMSRSGSFLGILWVTICVFISMSLHNAKDYLSIIILVVGLPFAFGIGAFIADRRLKYLCDPTLVDGFVEMAEPAIKMKKTRSRVVKWESSQFNKLISNKLYARLKFPTDVEIAARFALTSKPNQALIEKAKAVYMTGLSKFPKSPSVVQAYVNFIFTVLGDMQLGYITLEKLRKMKPPVDIQFFIYRYDKDREQRSDGGKDMVGDFVSYLEYKKMHQTAKRYHAAAAVSMRKFWKYLLEPQVDVLELSDLSSNIATAQKKASDTYLKLIHHHPRNIRILRDYARFLDEIVNDEHSAHEMWKRADKYETQEMEKITDSHRSATGGSSGAGLESEIDVVSTTDHTSEHSSEMDDASSSRSSGFGVGVAHARKERHHRLRVLGWIMFFTTLFALVVTFTQLGVLTTELNNYKRVVQVLDAAGAMSQSMGKMAIDTMDGYYLSLYTTYNIGPTSFQWIGNYDAAMASALSSTYVFGNIAKSIYWGTSNAEPFTTPGRRQLKIEEGYHIDIDISTYPMQRHEFDGKIANKKKITKFFDAPLTNATFASTNIYGKARPIDMWTLIMLMAGALEELTQMPMAVVASGDPHVMYNANMLLVNIYSLSDVATKFLDLCSELVESKLGSLFIILIIILAIAVSILAIAAVTVFRPVVSTIYQNKVKTLYMFTVIPHHIVKHMAKKKISSLRGVESDIDTDDEYMKTEKAISTAHERPADKPVMVRTAEPTHTPCATIRASPTPRASETLRTPRGSEIVRTPRGDTENQKHTLLLPNTIEEEDEEEEEERNTFKDLRGSDPELRAAQGLADKILVANEAKASSSSSSKKAKGKKKKRSSCDIEMEVRRSNNNNTNPDADGEEEEEEGTGRVQSFKEKANLSILPSFFPFHRRTSASEPAAHLTLPLVGKTKGEDSADDSDKKSNKLDWRAKSTKKNNATRLTVSSLRGVVTKMHLQYLLAIFLICIALAVSFFVTYEFVNDLENIANEIKLSDMRTQSVMLWILQATLFPLGPDVAIPSAELFKVTLDQIWNINSQMDPKPYQQDFLFAEKCLRINKTNCPDENYEFHHYVEFGFARLFFEYLSLGEDIVTQMLANNGTITATDPNYIKFRSIAANDIYDGLDIITFLVYVDAKQQISDAKQRIAICTVVTSVLFVLIHIVLFRPFVRKLRSESEHTFAILHMIPRRLLQEVPEIQAFLREEAGEIV